MEPTRVGLPFADAQNNVERSFVDVHLAAPSDYDRIIQPGYYNQGITIPEGEHWFWNVPIEIEGNFVCHGKLTMRDGAWAQWRNINEELVEGGGLVPKPNDWGFWGMHECELDWQGTPKLSWTRLEAGLQAGATYADLIEDPWGWNIGDEFFVAPMEPYGVPNQWKHDEVRRIVAIDSQRVHFDQPMQWPHPIVDVDGDLYGAEIGNLTRTCGFLGEPRSATKGRPHIFIHSHENKHLVKFVLFDRLGPRHVDNAHAGWFDTILGRWGFHLHHGFDSTRGSLVEGCVMRRAGNRGYVPHASHGVTFKDDITYDCEQSAMWWDRLGTSDPNNPEIDSTHDTKWIHCLAGRIRNTDYGERGGLYAFLLASGKGNEFLDCAAFGVDGDTDYRDHAGVGWVEKGGGFWKNKKFVCHNNRNHAYHFWMNHGTGTDLQGNPIEHVHEDMVLFNSRTGINEGAYENRVQFKRAKVVGCPTALVLHAASKPPPLALFEDCLLLGQVLIPKRIGGQSGGPVQFIRPRFDGVNQIKVDHTGSVAPDNIGHYDFIEPAFAGNPSREIEPSDFNVVRLQPGSWLRGQRRNGTAFKIFEETVAQVQTIKVEPIPAFWNE